MKADDEPGRVSPESPWVAGTKPSNYNVPNALTVLRIVLVPLFGWLLLAHAGHDHTFRYWAAFVFAVAMATDKIDGSIARRKNLITDFGKLADPIADKAMTGMAFIGLSAIGVLWWWVTVLVLARELGITVMRMWLKRFAVLPAGKGGKLKTVLQTLGLFMLVLPWTGVWQMAGYVVIAAAVAVTVGTGIDYAWAGWKLWRAQERGVRAGH